MKKMLMAFAILCSASALQAEPDYYVALCAWAPGQIPMASSSVIYGVRCTLFYGDCTRLNGLDLALVGANRTRERFNGLAIASVFNRANSAAGAELGFANVIENEFSGLQGGVWDHASHGYGAQLGGVSTAGYFAGLQAGAFNWADELAGLQGGVWNHASHGCGVQLGGVNTAGYFAGLQMGVFNWASDLDGLQIGLINVIADLRSEKVRRQPF